MPKKISDKLKSIVAAPVAKPKLKRERVRPDSFSLLTSEHELIQKLMDRALEQGLPVSKSQIVRAGIHALVQMNDARLVQALGELPHVRAGRPPIE